MDVVSQGALRQIKKFWLLLSAVPLFLKFARIQARVFSAVDARLLFGISSGGMRKILLYGYVL